MVQKKKAHLQRPIEIKPLYAPQVEISPAASRQFPVSIIIKFFNFKSLIFSS